MYAIGKCPNQGCAKTLDRADMGAIVIGNTPKGPFYNGISALCPHCRTIVGVTIDPTSLGEDIVAGVLRGLRPGAAKTK
jgi:hypothetical protein